MISHFTTNFLEDHIDKLSYSKSFFKRHVLSRGANLVLAPCSAMTHTLDTIIGVGALLGACAFLGRSKTMCDIAVRHVLSSSYILAGPHKLFLKVLNPPKSKQPQSKIPSVEGNGLLSGLPILKKLLDKSEDYSSSKNFFKRHVISRLSFALTGISCSVARVADGIISVPATALSILTLGRIASINNLANQSLQAPGIISDISITVLLILNPQLYQASEK